MRTGVRFCIFLALVAATWTGLGAAMPTFWTVSTQADFLKGDVEDLSIDSDGRVFLGPSTSLIAETAAPFLWTLLPGADGSFWAGTGNEGKVLKIGKDGKVATFFDATELEVHAIVQAPNNALYVATSPDGKIYHVSADGTARTFFDPEDKYIWALALDRAGNLFAATGDKGVIYKITPDGKGSRFYKTSSTNVVSLAFSPTGDLLAGTESPGRVFRIDATGKAFVLLDSPFKEIHALRLADDGTLYAAAVSGSTAVTEDRSLPTPGADPGRAPVPTVSTEITAISVVDTGASQVAAPVISGASRRSNRGAIYRIRPNGLWDTYWETGEDSPYDLLVEPGGSLLVGTGPEGKIFRVTGDPARATLLSRATARQVTALLREPSGRVVGATSNPGKVFALSATPATKGTYESDVRDAGTVASWGAIRWRATGQAWTGAAADAVRQHGEPGRDLERVVEGVCERGRRTDREPERALPAVARGAHGRRRAVAGADVGDRGLPAAQSPARGGDDHRASGRHGLSAAVLGQRDRDRRLRGEHLGRPRAVAGAGRSRRHSSAAAAARPAALSEGPADDRVEGRRRQRRSPAVRRLVPARGRDRVEGPEARHLGCRSSCGTRPRSPTAPTSSASPPPTRRRMPRRPRWPARWRAPASISTTPPRASRRSPPRAPARARRLRSRFATTSRRCSGSSTRSTRAGGGWSIRRTAFRIPGARSSRWWSTTASPAAASSSAPPTR